MTTNQIKIVKRDNGVIIVAEKSLITKVLGEPTIDPIHDEFYWEGPNSILIGYGDSDICNLYGESKLKDLSFSKTLMKSINGILGKPLYNYSVELLSRNTIFTLK